MINYLAPTVGSIQFITLYKDLVDEGVNFTTLDVTPYTILPAQGFDKCIVPLNIVVDYYSTGTGSEFYIYSNNIPNIGEAMFNFFNQPVGINQSGILTIPNFLAVTSNSVQVNNILNESIFLATAQSASSLIFTRFRIYFTYYIQNIIP
jgi:hypothetical protein